MVVAVAIDCEPSMALPEGASCETESAPVVWGLAVTEEEDSPGGACSISIVN